MENSVANCANPTSNLISYCLCLCGAGGFVWKAVQEHTWPIVKDVIPKNMA